MLTNSTETFGLVSRFTHWFILILVVMAALGGLHGSELEKSPEKADIIFMHKSVGVMILLVMLFRVIWRFINQTPKALDANKKNTRIAKFVQLLLIVLLIAQPVVGIIMTQASGQPVSPFGFFELPALTVESESLAAKMKELHGRLLIAIFGLTFAHFAGTLKQHFIVKNNTLLRMLKG